MRNSLTLLSGLGIGLAVLVSGGPARAFAPFDGKKDRDKKAEEKIKLAELDPEFQGRVNEAVKRAIPWLLSRQAQDGHFPTCHDAAGHGPFPHGGTALSLLALLKSGHPAVSDEIEKGMKWLKDSWDQYKAGGMQVSKNGWKTYEVGITLMMLEAMWSWRPQSMQKHKTVAMGRAFKPAWKAWVKELRDFLIKHEALSRQETNTSKNGGGGLIDHKETWSYPSAQAKLSDHSNTQYAVLGLHAAQKMGEPTSAKVWRGILEGMIYTQAETGPQVPRKVAPPRRPKDPYVHHPRTISGMSDRARGWGYNGAAKPQAGTGQMAETGSMTTVGLACVALAWHNMTTGRDKDGRKFAKDRKLREGKERALRDGFAWLDKNWTVEKNPNYGTWHYYYLYGLERSGILAQQQMIGGHDWYREGGELLLNQQRGAMWDDGNGDGAVCSTCFALLFLTRATVPLTTITHH